MNMRRFLRVAAVVCVGATLSAGALRAADDAKSGDSTKADAHGWHTLFNGKDLDGWKVNEHPETFKVENGEIVVRGDRSHLFYVGPVADHNFKNFHFRAEVMTKPKANSGIYFHTKFQDEGFPSQGFECQVNQTHGDPKKTGGLYAVKDVMNQSPVKDGEWYTYDITVQGKHVVLAINGKTTTDWTEPDGWKPPEGMPGRRIGSGTFALQGHDPGSEIHYRNIQVQVLPE